MAVQLNARAGGGERVPARTGAAIERGLVGMVRDEIAVVGRSWAVVVMLVVVVFPAAVGVFGAEGYMLRDNFDLFSVMLDGWLPLLFPILVTALYLPHLQGDVAFGYLRAARTRASMPTLVASRLWAAAALAFLAFLLSILIAGIIAFGLNDAGAIAGIQPPRAGETVHAVASRTAFSPLYPVSPWLYLAVFSPWVAVNAALWAVFGGLAVLTVDNRFLALALPVLAYHGGDVVLAYLGLEELRFSASIFQSNVTQQPVWSPFVQLGVLTAVIGAMVWWLRRKEFESAALAR